MLFFFFKNHFEKRLYRKTNDLQIKQILFKLHFKQSLLDFDFLFNKTVTRTRQTLSLLKRFNTRNNPG